MVKIKKTARAEAYERSRVCIGEIQRLIPDSSFANGIIYVNDCEIRATHHYQLTVFEVSSKFRDSMWDDSLAEEELNFGGAFSIPDVADQLFEASKRVQKKAERLKKKLEKRAEENMKASAELIDLLGTNEDNECFVRSGKAQIIFYVSTDQKLSRTFSGQFENLDGDDIKSLVDWFRKRKGDDKAKNRSRRNKASDRPTKKTHPRVKGTAGEVRDGSKKGRKA